MSSEIQHAERLVEIDQKRDYVVWPIAEAR